MHRFLKQAKRAAAAAALALLAMPPMGGVQAMPPTMPAEEIAAGMTGTGYTVFDSAGEIQPFQVDVLGISESGKGSDRRIMARASGPLVEASRGVLQGMSGSPIYIDGRLVGALSYGNAVDSYTFFITPIGDMMTLWDYPDSKNKRQVKTVDLKKFAEDRAKAAEDAAKEKDAAEGAADADGEAKASEASDEAKTASGPEPAAAEETAAAATNATESAGESGAEEPTEAKSILYFSGFNQGSIDFLKKSVTALDWGGVQPFSFPAAGGTDATDYQAAVEPGSPVGVALVCGDFFVGATGTVTAVDGNRILAFGHPFMHRGNVNYFLTDASAVGTIGGYGAGMRIANPGSIIGRISQDREYGIAGILGEFPAVVPVKVSVKDENHQFADQTFHSNIAYDEAVLPQLSAGIAYASMTRAADREGAGTAKVHFVIRTDAAEDGKVERSNMYYNLSDVGQVAVQELAQAMNIICTNTEREADILDVQVDVSLDGARKTASLISAVPEKLKVKPGETVNIKTTIQPYRQQKETLVIPYTVPKAQKEGALHLDVRGGGFVPVTPLLLLQQQGVDTSAEEDKTQTMKDKLRDLSAAGKNNEIIVAPGAAATLLSEKEQKKAVREAAKASAKAARQSAAQERQVSLLGANAKKEAPKEAKVSTDYIIDNVIHATLQVERG